MVGAIELYNAALAKLKNAGLEDPRADANVLFETACGIRRSQAFRDTTVSDDAAERLRALVGRRISGEPLQYIVGRWPFLDFELEVGEGVLIPRPETEQLAETASDFLKTRRQPSALDLCSGTGCIPIAIKRAVPQCDVTAVELDDAAFCYLARNTAACAPEIKTVSGDALHYYSRLADSSLDCITSNPPYLTPDEYDGCAELEHEPRLAFVGGRDGLDFYRAIAPAYLSKLKSGGMLIFEIGDTQGAAVSDIMTGAGYERVLIKKDIFGLDRIALGYRP